MFQIITSLSRRQKRMVLLALDFVLLPVAFFGALALAHNSLNLGPTALEYWPLLPVLMALGLAVSYGLGIPNVQLKAYDDHAMVLTAVLALAMSLAAGLIGSTFETPLTVAGVVIFGLLFFLISVATRMTLRHWLIEIYRRNGKRCRVLIYGAGTTGVQLAAALSSDETIRPVAFVDDNKAMKGLIIAGLQVHHSKHLRSLVERAQIDRVVLAMPGLSQPRQLRLARRLSEMGLEVQRLPSFAQIVGAEGLVQQLQPVTPDDLLERETLHEELSEVIGHYAKRTVLVSGAGGSIGSELCRQVLKAEPDCLILMDSSEPALYNIDRELTGLKSDVRIIPILGSVADAPLVRLVLERHKVEVVLHAAAYKHVPMVEANPLTGVANNVLGTQVLAKAAGEAGVERFILISTDKAVRPTNIMGSSKRLAELVIQDLANRSDKTIYSMVRFGNVMGSSGSVIPLFHDQIARGGPVTLTHSQVTRYFMTIPEAARLVLAAGVFATGGDVFVLDMGKPVVIRDLARAMIERSGYTVRDADNPDGDIEIVITGLRPGEKLYEELLIDDSQIPTPHRKILRAKEKHLSEIEVASALQALRLAVAEADEDAVRRAIAKWVDGYDPGKEPLSLPLGDTSRAGQ